MNERDVKITGKIQNFCGRPRFSALVALRTATSAGRPTSRSVFCVCACVYLCHLWCVVVPSLGPTAELARDLAGGERKRRPEFDKSSILLGHSPLARSSPLSLLAALRFGTAGGRLSRIYFFSHPLRCHCFFLRPVYSSRHSVPRTIHAHSVPPVSDVTRQTDHCSQLLENPCSTWPCSIVAVQNGVQSTRLRLPERRAHTQR